eukprot:752846-Hanusia_phi.AAC.1
MEQRRGEERRSSERRGGGERCGRGRGGDGNGMLAVVEVGLMLRTSFSRVSRRNKSRARPGINFDRSEKRQF